jgi:hypothetical protein
MPGQDILKKFYPGILSITYEDVKRLSQGNSDLQSYLMRVYHDLMRAKRRTQLEGWTYKSNPFVSMDLGGWTPPKFTDVMQMQYDMTLRANGWFGIGIWGLAEEYYKIAISLALVSNDVIATLQNGANLALCYLGAGDCENALQVCNDLLKVVTKTKVYGAEVFRQSETIRGMCLLELEKRDEVIRRVQGFIKFLLPEQLLPDESIFTIVAQVYETVGADERLYDYRLRWIELQNLVRDITSI